MVFFVQVIRKLGIRGFDRENLTPPWIRRISANSPGNGKLFMVNLAWLEASRVKTNQPQPQVAPHGSRRKERSCSRLSKERERGKKHIKKKLRPNVISTWFYMYIFFNTYTVYRIHISHVSCVYPYIWICKVYNKQTALVRVFAPKVTCQVETWKVAGLQNGQQERLQHGLWKVVTVTQQDVCVRIATNCSMDAK